MKQKILFITLITFLLLFIACTKEEKVIEKGTPPAFDPSEKPPEKQDNPIEIKQKLTVIDEEGRALEIEVKEE